MKTVLERLMAKVEHDAAGCWLFRGCLVGHGYGRINIAGRLVLAHRASWAIHNGEVPAGKCVLHHCDKPGCINPAHLFLGTQADNVTDMITKGRSKSNAAINAVKTHCKRGHELTKENVRVTEIGGRRCKTCRAAAEKQYRMNKSSISTKENHQ